MNTEELLYVLEINTEELLYVLEMNTEQLKAKKEACIQNVYLLSNNKSSLGMGKIFETINLSKQHWYAHSKVA